MFYYIEKGATLIRLDAIAFIWKELGTECVHLPQTHEILKGLNFKFQTLPTMFSFGHISSRE